MALFMSTERFELPYSSRFKVGMFGGPYSTDSSAVQLTDTIFCRLDGMDKDYKRSNYQPNRKTNK